MAKIHFILQGKGGVGKSMIASMLYQGLTELCREDGRPVIAYDTDPVNATLKGFEEFNVHGVEIMKGTDIDPRKFDDLLESLVTSPESGHVIVDNGASSFVALGSYLQENEVIPILTDRGHTVLFHSVVTGGQALGDTISGLEDLTQGFPDAPIAVWLNPYFGEIASPDGRPFEQFGVYTEYEKQIVAVLRLPDENKATYGRDIEDLFAKKWSFLKGAKAAGKIAEQQRLMRYWKKILALVNNPNIME